MEEQCYFWEPVRVALKGKIPEAYNFPVNRVKLSMGAFPKGDFDAILIAPVWMHTDFTKSMFRVCTHGF